MFGIEGKKRKALAYYRHSAEDKQENSVPLQREQTETFAAKYDIEIIHEEADEGKSGLSAARPGFERLFDDWVLNPDAPQFDYIFVLDVTRWGRFQDPDEAAYWEMQCKKRNIRVIYISRGFPKEEERLLTSLETSIGRYMAAEYSRQLSDKVWHGSMKVSEQGYSAGGTAPYGYNRVLFDEQRNRIGILEPGAHKVIANQRVSFEPATDGTQDVVKEIFTTFTNGWVLPQEIADSLNERNILSATGKEWDGSKIIRVLSNEAYTGTRVYNKTWSRLKQKQRKNPTEEWVRCIDAFDPIIDRQTFELAQERLYWAMPSRWKHGTRKLDQTRNEMRTYATELLEHFDDDKRYWALKRLPVSFGLTYYRDGIAQRCFRISEDMRRHSNIIGVSVNMFVKDKIDGVFSLPTDKFGVGDYLVLPDNDKSISEYILNAETTAEQLRNLCDKIPAY
jgi:DNA invertase Pin-like site-specific DNA recombinase